jgi:carbonic anhydrase
MKKLQKISFLLAFLAISSFSVAQVAPTKSNEIKDTAPDAKTKVQQGYALPGLDHGFEQSPINIISSKTDSGKHKITMHYKDEINKIENLGHTVQLDFQAGSNVTVDGETFDFKQCHFHTPSEHLIDGQTFPAEMHIVNIMPNVDKKATPQYLVFGVLFKEGKENKFIADFLNSIPKEEKETIEVKAGVVKLSDLFGNVSKGIKGHYYHYKGSLTTPPFTESVRWYITKHIFEASAEQIEAINKIEGNNARHVQALYGRMISTK